MPIDTALSVCLNTLHRFTERPMNTPNFHAVARAFRDLAAERDRLERLRNSEAGEIVSEVLAILYIESENHEHRPEFARAVQAPC